MSKKMTILDEASSSRQQLNSDLNYQPLKVIFELITNIPKIANNILWKFNKHTKGLLITFKQDRGAILKDVQEGILTREKLKQADHFEKKDGENGGLFGTGLSLVKEYSLEMKFRTEGKQWNTFTDEITPYDIDANTVEIEILLPIASYKTKYIEEAKKLIGRTDFFRKLDDRSHKFLVENFKPTDNDRLSTPIQKEKLVWKDKFGVEKDTPDYDKVKDSSGNPITEDILEIELSRGKRGDEVHNVKLKDFQIGKLKVVPKSWGIQDTNKPFMVMVSEEADQVVGITPWMGGHPTSTNNSCIICRVSKVDLRCLFGTADKAEGFHGTAEGVFVKWMKNVLNNYYPDSNAQEAGGQFWARDIIVYDKIGTKPSHDFRNDIGLGWMSKLSIKQREKLVFLEWSAGKDRFDFYIWVAKNGQVGPNTKKIIGESKKKGFDSKALNQLNGYIASEAKVVGGIGFSCSISDKDSGDFTKTTTKIKGAGQYKVTQDFHLMDLLSYGFDNYVNEYTTLGMKKTKEAREKAKLEAQREREEQNK